MTYKVPKFYAQILTPVKDREMILMSLFKSREHEVTAFQWTPTAERPEWFDTMITEGKCFVYVDSYKGTYVEIQTKGAWVKAYEDEWILRDSEGITETMTDEQFKKKYIIDATLDKKLLS